MPVLDHRRLDALADQQARQRLLDAHERLLQRASFLLDKDRALLELAVSHGLPRRRISSLLQLSSSAVTRRIQRIIRRLNNPIVPTLLHESCPLPPEVRQIGIEHFVQGRSIRSLSRLHERPTHEIRRVLQNVRAWHRWSSPRRTSIA